MTDAFTHPTRRELQLPKQVVALPIREIHGRYPGHREQRDRGADRLYSEEPLLVGVTMTLASARRSAAVAFYRPECAEREFGG